MKKTKIIVIFGGVYSSLGKGVIAASLGRILKELGNNVSSLKCDPYLNVDPGTLSPYQHGEVFVTVDGGETDLDLGTYERFLGKNLSKLSNITSGKIYSEIIEKERAGKFNGKTVQVIPDITNLIKQKITNLINHDRPDFLLVEVGGTVGDIESIPFVEALNQFSIDYGRDNVMFTLCAPLIKIPTNGEIKTKPTQHSFKELGNLGIMPNMLILRTSENVPSEIINKISQNCHLNEKAIFLSLDLKNTFDLPIELYKQSIHQLVYQYFGYKLKESNNINHWINYVKKIHAIKKSVKVTIVGKYIEYQDAYISLIYSLKLAGYELNINVQIDWIDATNLTHKNYQDVLKNAKAILVPGGFGERGIEGKILAIKYARTKKIPFLGICLGMQLAVIEFARAVANLLNANSKEFNPTSKNCLFDYIDGRMRLGLEPIQIIKNTLAHKIYKQLEISERHRHRYEFVNDFQKLLEKYGMIFSGFSKDKNPTVEIIELKNHPFFIACQYHPEFASKPQDVDKLFIAFLKQINH